VEAFMQVGKWGNSLAIRLPAAVVESLGLKEVDEIEIDRRHAFLQSQAGHQQGRGAPAAEGIELVTSSRLPL
jgi:antitoxin component of MazEF toxin-antitoxin module